MHDAEKIEVARNGRACEQEALTAFSDRSMPVFTNTGEPLKPPIEQLGKVSVECTELRFRRLVRHSSDVSDPNYWCVALAAMVHHEEANEEQLVAESGSSCRSMISSVANISSGMLLYTKRPSGRGIWTAVTSSGHAASG